jgi:hypothetical protein
MSSQTGTQRADRPSPLRPSADRRSPNDKEANTVEANSNRRCAGLPASAPRLRPGPTAQAARIAVAYALLWIITLLGEVIGKTAPALAPGGPLRSTPHGGLGDLASIALTNARVLSAPFLLALFRFQDHRCTRRLGDLVIGGVLGANGLRVGLALGRWHDRLLPYLPQLPLEWLAAALAAVSWLALRTGVRRPTALAYLAAVLVLVIAAAAVETIATPHASP